MFPTNDRQFSICFLLHLQTCMGGFHELVLKVYITAASPSHELEQLPGFRFHPTEEELLNFYLQRMVAGNKLHGDVIGFLNIYKYHPTDLPGLARINGEREWYFFVPRDRRHGGGGRPNRTTENGFWKATGSDKKILSLSDPKRMLGAKKTLVFYEGRAPRGRKTDWVMNEYRLPEATVQEVVLCKVYRKATSLKVLEQRAAEEEARACISPAPLMTDTTSSLFDFDLFEDVKLTGGDMLKFSMDWNQDALWSFENLTPFMPLC